MVKPLVPSGILGPFMVCLADVSPLKIVLLICGVKVSSPLPARNLDFPRPLFHTFFDPAATTEFSSPCTKGTSSSFLLS